MKRLTHEDIVRLLKEKQGNQSTAEFAKTIGYSRQHLYEVYRGVAEPGPTILSNLGVEKVVTVSYVQTENPPVTCTEKKRRWR